MIQHNEKLTQLTKELDDKTVIFIKSFANLHYFLGYIPTVKTRPFALLYGKKTIIISPMTSFSDIADKLPSFKIVPYTEFPSTLYATNFEDAIRHYLHENKSIQTIKFEGDTITYQDLQLFSEFNLAFIDITNTLTTIKSIKTPKELEKIKEAANFSNTMISNCIDSVHLGLSEIEIDDYSKQLTKENIHLKIPDAQIEFFALTTIGFERTTLPHTVSSTNEVVAGDPLLFCRQVSINGYRAQCDRMLFTKQLTMSEEYYYTIVLKAHEHIIKFIKPGVTAEQIDLTIREFFKQYEVEEYYIHRSGSSVGLQMAEPPFLQIKNTTTITSGMVLIIQPALYIPNIGGFRISDTLLITNTGCELLTTYPREMQKLIKTL